jgi:hypothetical protein
MIKESVSEENMLFQQYEDKKELLAQLLKKEEIDASDVEVLNHNRELIYRRAAGDCYGEKKRCLAAALGGYHIRLEQGYSLNIFVLRLEKRHHIANINLGRNDRTGVSNAIMRVFDKQYYERLKRVAEQFGLEEISKSWDLEPGERMIPKEVPRRVAIIETEDCKPRYARGIGKD